MYNKQWCRAGSGLKLLAHVKRFTPEFLVFEMDDNTVIEAGDLHCPTDYMTSNIIKDIDRIIEEHPETANGFKKTTSKVVTGGLHKYSYLINRQGVFDFIKYTSCSGCFDYFVEEVEKLMKNKPDVIPELKWGYRRLKTMKWW